MKTSSKHVERGTARDQETIVSIRPRIEDYVREDLKIDFARTKLFWNMNKKGTFNFEIHFFE